MTLAMSLLSFAELAQSQPSATAPPQQPVVEQLPLTAKAPSDEVLGERKRTDPVMPVEYAPRLVASEPRMVADDLPSYQLPYRLRREATLNRPLRGHRATLPPIAPSAGVAVASVAHDAAMKQVEAATSAKMQVTAQVSGPAVVTEPGKSGDSRDGAKTASPFSFAQRLEWLVLGLLVVVLVLLCSGLIAMLRRRARPARLISPVVHGQHQKLSGASGPLQPAVHPKGPAAVQADAPPLTAAASGLAPGRLAHALAGLNSEMEDGSAEFKPFSRAQPSR